MTLYTNAVSKVIVFVRNYNKKQQEGCKMVTIVVGLNRVKMRVGSGIHIVTLTGTG